MVELSDFTNAAGTRIKWQALAGSIVGGAVLAFWSGWSAVVLTAADFWTRLVGGAMTFVVDLVTVYIGVPTAIIRGSWAGALGTVREAGPLAFVVALAIVLTTIWLFAQVVSRLG